MTADFVYTRNSLNRALGSIQSRHRFIEHDTDLFQYSRVGFVFRIEGENALSGGIENHFAKRNPPQLRIFPAITTESTHQLRLFQYSKVHQPFVHPRLQGRSKAPSSRDSCLQQCVQNLLPRNLSSSWGGTSQASDHAAYSSFNRRRQSPPPSSATAKLVRERRLFAHAHA